MDAMKTKRPALLLELLIAMSLLAIGLVGLIKSPASLHRAQARAFEKAECERLAAWVFTELRETLTQMSWTKIPPLNESSKRVELGDKRSYVLTTLEEKRLPEGPTRRLVSVEFRIHSHKFTYRVIVEKAC